VPGQYTVTANQNLSLTPLPSTVSGTVTTSSGTPVAQTTPNASGNYSFTGISPGSYTISVMATNFQYQSIITQSNQTTNVNFTLQPSPGAVFGTITNAQTGTVIPNATVQLLSINGTLMASTTTNASGDYSFTDLAPGQSQIKAVSTNFSTNTLIESTLTDGNGVYLAEGLPEGNAVVTTTFQNYAASVNSTSLSPNQTKVLNIVLSPFPSTIVGTVTDNATANMISGVSVQLVIVQTGITVASTVTSSDRTYTLANLPQGTFNIIFSANNYTTQTFTVNLTPGEVEMISPSLTPNPATITGTVLDSVTSTPITNALVQVFNSQDVFVASVLTDMNGQYTLSGLPEGTLTVAASTADFGTGIQTVTLTDGQT